MSIFKACDVRGVFGDEWTREDAHRIGRSLGRMIGRRDGTPVCVGGDCRKTTPTIQQALLQGLLEAGRAVYDVGPLPTPAVYFAARRLGCQHVAIVTASHNAAPYNGIKFMVAGRPARPDLIHELEHGLDGPLPSGQPGVLQRAPMLAAYQQWVVPFAAHVVAGLRPEPAPAFESQPLRLVLDTMHGAATAVAPAALAAAECEVESVCACAEGDFAGRVPNPAVDAYLEPLQERMRHQRADLGVALDGDGDRVILVTADGRIVRPEQLAALLLRHGPACPTIVYDLKCASLVEREARRAGGIAVMQPSGYGYIKSAMLDRHADLGVEVSGHHFYSALGGGDDGLFTALIVLGLLRRTRRPLHELLAPFPWPAISPDVRVPYTGNPAALLEQLAAACGGTVSRLDGVRAEYPQGWALARGSITEPAVTFRFEAPSQAELAPLATRFLAGAAQLLDLVLEKIHE